MSIDGFDLLNYFETRAQLREPKGYAILRGVADQYTEPGEGVNDMED